MSYNLRLLSNLLHVDDIDSDISVELSDDEEEKVLSPGRVFAERKDKISRQVKVMKSYAKTKLKMDTGEDEKQISALKTKLATLDVTELQRKLDKDKQFVQLDKFFQGRK